MTFYNVLSGILFLAACRQLLVLMDTSVAWTAATIAVIVFNDALNTSHVLESRNSPPYTIGMKLLDLLAFLLVSLALIAVQPADNPFGVVPREPLASWLQPAWVPWALMATYWAAAVVLWNWLAGIYGSPRWPCWAQVVSHCLVVPFVLMALVTWLCGTPADVPWWCNVITFTLVALYFVALKPLTLKPA